MNIDLIRSKLNHRSVTLQNGCKIWIGGVKKNNLHGSTPLLYGKLMFGYHTYMVHQLAVYVETGSMPTQHVSHRCHNSLCINPAHLCCEAQSTNNQRKVCVGLGECTAQHLPLCIPENRLGKVSHLIVYPKVVVYPNLTQTLKLPVDHDTWAIPTEMGTSDPQTLTQNANPNPNVNPNSNY